MALGPVLTEEGFPLLLEEGEGFLPAIAEDPCDCCEKGCPECGPRDSCTVCAEELMPCYLTLTISGVQPFSGAEYFVTPLTMFDDIPFLDLNGVYEIPCHPINPCSYEEDFYLGRFSNNLHMNDVVMRISVGFNGVIPLLLIPTVVVSLIATRMKSDNTPAPTTELLFPPTHNSYIKQVGAWPHYTYFGQTSVDTCGDFPPTPVYVENDLWNLGSGFSFTKAKDTTCQNTAETDWGDLDPLRGILMVVRRADTDTGTPLGSIALDYWEHNCPGANPGGRAAEATLNPLGRTYADNNLWGADISNAKVDIVW